MPACLRHGEFITSELCRRAQLVTYNNNRKTVCSGCKSKAPLQPGDIRRLAKQGGVPDDEQYPTLFCWVCWAKVTGSSKTGLCQSCGKHRIHRNIAPFDTMTAGEFQQRKRWWLAESDYDRRRFKIDQSTRLRREKKLRMEKTK